MIPTVLLIEDHSLVRSGIRSLLDGSDAVKVIGEAGSGLEAVAMSGAFQPDIVLADVEMPGMNGIDAVRMIHAAQPGVKIIMLSTYSDAKYVYESIQAGAMGYVLKYTAFPELMVAIRRVAEGGTYFSEPLGELVYTRTGKLPQAVPDVGLDKLTHREKEVLRLVADGKTSEEIAGLLKFTGRTAEAHRANIMQKLGIRSVAGLTKFAITNGLTTVG